MSKRVKRSELVELIRKCLNNVLLSQKKTAYGFEVNLNSIYANVKFFPNKWDMIKDDIESIVNDLNSLLKSYTGENLKSSHICDNNIFIQVEYEIVD